MNQRISYREARGSDGNSTRRFLGNIARGKFWYVAEDFKDGRSVDPQPVQAKKAEIVLQELDAKIAEFGDIDSLTNDHCGKGSRVDVQAQIMLMTFQAEMAFNAAVIKTKDDPQPQPQFQTKTIEETELRNLPSSGESDEIGESGDEKLARARELVRSGKIYESA